MSPAQPSPRFSDPAIIDHAATAFIAYKNSADYALDLGIDPAEVISIARGERTISGLHAQSPWFLGRIVALMRSKRAPNSLGSQILAATAADPYAWGIKRTGDRDRDLAALLDLIE